MRRALVVSSMILFSSVSQAQKTEEAHAQSAPFVESYYRSKGFSPATDSRRSWQRFAQASVQGWTVWVADDLQADPLLEQQVIDRLATKLGEARLVLPAHVYEKLRQSTGFWIEKHSPHWSGAVYHPSAEWLLENGMDPNRAKHVEIGNARNFLDWMAEQPAMVIHELTHAFHDKLLPDGWGNATLLDAYQKAVDSRRYEQVAYVKGGLGRAYALTNVMEYFSELSEAYFWRNDFYPFVRWDIAEYDPFIYPLLPQLWGGGKVRATEGALQSLEVGLE
jgi:dipeptidyl-peptidase-4